MQRLTSQWPSASSEDQVKPGLQMFGPGKLCIVIDFTPFFVTTFFGPWWFRWWLWGEMREIGEISDDLDLWWFGYLIIWISDDLNLWWFRWWLWGEMREIGEISCRGISTHHLPLLLPQSLRDDHLLTIMIMITTIFNAQALCDDGDHCWIQKQFAKNCLFLLSSVFS